MPPTKPTSQPSLPPMRDYQVDDVQAILDDPTHRKLICHPPAAGKTRIAIEVAKALGAKKILVISPALARPVWVEEFARWAGWQAHVVSAGINVKSRSQPAQARVEAAYKADIRVTSYGLLSNFCAVDAAWEYKTLDLIIFDEIHALRDPFSQVSRNARKIMAKNPKTPCIGLTATPIPTRTEQAWNPINTLFPGWHGVRKDTADIPWSFLTAYCERQENEYGVVYTGPKSEIAMQALKRAISPYIRRVNPGVIEKYLPPVDAKPLFVEDGHSRVWVRNFVADSVAEEIRHIAVVPYRRETAQAIYADVSKTYSRKLAAENRGVYHFDGQYAPEARSEMLLHFRDHGGILICTCESIRESINLSFVKSALITEWRTSPAQALQLLGRFRRPNKDPSVNRVRYLTTPDDASRAKLLQRRLDALAIVLQSDDSQAVLQEVFSSKECTDDELDAMLESITSTHKTTEQKELW
jgi:superfamily II DNA or RNA helicase